MTTIITENWLETKGFKRLTPDMFQLVIPGYAHGVPGVELRVLNTITRWAVSIAADGLFNKFQSPENEGKQFYEPTFITGREFRRPEDLLKLMEALGWTAPGEGKGVTE